MKREEAIKLIDTHTVCFYNEIDSPTLQALHMAIEALQDRPTGEWILECDSEGEGDNLYRCPYCGNRIGCQEYDKPKFCDNCGADMRGDTE